jgi:hypothetical protein
MHTQDTARELVEQTRSAAMSRRAYDDAYWTLGRVYDHGPQWGFINTRNGSAEVKFMPSITDPQREDIRVAVNKIHEVVVRIKAGLAPKSIDFQLKPRSAASRVMKFVGEQAMEKHLSRIHALEILRAKNDGRCVLGSMIVRRTLTTQGQPMQIPEGGEIRSIRPGLALVYPWEIIRDPSANSTSFQRDEQIVIHEKPQTVEWFRANWGVEIDTTATMGQLYDYQRQLESATGRVGDRYLSDSKQRGAIAYEAYIQDSDVPGDWPLVFYGYMNVSADREHITPRFFGRNPFYGNPLHEFHYDTQLQSPWGRGIPHILMAAQDVNNIAVTWLVRMMQQGSGKWRYVEGSIDAKDIRRVLGPRISESIPWRQINNYTQAPERVPPPQVNPATIQLLERCPQWMQEAIGLNPVQMGEVSKRGESAKAVQMRIDQADAPMEQIRQDDDLALAELLFGMGCDLTNPSHLRLDEARDLLGDAVPDDMIRLLLREPFEKHIEKVIVNPGTHRPETPDEVGDQFVNLAINNVMPPDKALWQAMLRGKHYDADMQRAFEYQMLEIEAMKAGIPAEVQLPENHLYHQWTVEYALSDQSSMEWTPEVKQAISNHWTEHEVTLLTRAMGAGQPQAGQPQPGQPSPPAMTGQPSAPSGAAAPTM